MVTPEDIRWEVSRLRRDVPLGVILPLLEVGIEELRVDGALRDALRDLWLEMEILYAMADADGQRDLTPEERAGVEALADGMERLLGTV